jgi:hypothetical protein
MPEHLTTWIPKLAGQRILVIGDVILDEYLIGKAARLSREAPIPVLEFESRQLIPAGSQSGCQYCRVRQHRCTGRRDRFDTEQPICDRCSRRAVSTPNA